MITEFSCGKMEKIFFWIYLRLILSIERKKASEENETNSSFYEEIGDRNFVMTMFHLFLAGSETTSTSLTFAVLFMLHFPEPFKIAQAELDDVVGPSRLPNCNDRYIWQYWLWSFKSVDRTTELRCQISRFFPHPTRLLGTFFLEFLTTRLSIFCFLKRIMAQKDTTKYLLFDITYFLI